MIKPAVEEGISNQKRRKEGSSLFFLRSDAHTLRLREERLKPEREETLAERSGSGTRGRMLADLEPSRQSSRQK